MCGKKNKEMSKHNITVIGIGAMGGGMARALLDSPISGLVQGFDHASTLVDAFYDEAKAAGKASPTKPSKLAEAITTDTSFVLIVLQNEPQCEAVCFGGGGGDTSGGECLLSLLAPGVTVILSSTVTAVWSQKAAERFATKGIHFVDCPISGGPARARQGDLTLMASGDDESLAKARNAGILDALGSKVHIIEGGPGMGSTVKMVHQLLAGVHIVAAAEALSLAAKAGLNVAQMYEIVNGAAGASWMFQDRGARMLEEDMPQPPKSQSQIFVKDLDIVYAEAKRLQAPIPLASVALQQFISATSLGLAKQDDSQVKKVYEQITGVPVGGKTGLRKEGDNVGDLWTMADGTKEEILEVGNEPRHKTVLSNEYVRAIRVSFPPNDTTLAHRHAEDSLYFFLVEGTLTVVNHVQGSDPACDCMEFGEIRFGTHKSDKPLVHKITNKTDQQMLCIDAEVLKQPPITAAIPLVADFHELVKTRDKCRVYKLSLQPNESITVTYPFFYFTVILQPGTVQRQIGPLAWKEVSHRGDVSWKEPTMDMNITNVGSTTFVQYIAEWR